MTKKIYTDAEIRGALRILAGDTRPCHELFEVEYGGFYCITCRLRPKFKECGPQELKIQYAKELIAHVSRKRLYTLALETLL